MKVKVNDSQLKANRNVNFFRFPCGKTPEQNSRRAVWEEFCKRKAFKPSLCTKICSLHFAEESYEPSHSPQFLESISIGYTEKTSLRLIDKPTTSASVSKVSASSQSKRNQTCTFKTQTFITTDSPWFSYLILQT